MQDEEGLTGKAYSFRFEIFLGPAGRIDFSDELEPAGVHLRSCDLKVETRGAIDFWETLTLPALLRPPDGSSSPFGIDQAPSSLLRQKGTARMDQQNLKSKCATAIGQNAGACIRFCRDLLCHPVNLLEA